MKKLIAAFTMAGVATLGAQTATAADFEPQAAIQQLVVSGVVESWSGYTFYSDVDVDSTPDPSDSFFSHYSGRLSLPFGESLSGQMDVDAEINTSLLLESSDANTSEMEHAFQGIFHLSSRDPNTGLIGAFGGAGRGAGDGNGVYPFYVAGGEGQLYLQDFTLYVQAGYFNITSNASHDGDGMSDALFGRGVVRWFLEENTRLQGEVSYADGKMDGDDEANVVEWAVRYDTVLEDLPLIGDAGVFVGYRGARFENEQENDEFTDHTIMVGFRHAFGGSTMKEIDRVGATLDAPTIGRWVGAGNILD
ncbi:MAG: hypothetical protein ABJM26_12120 [Anderseniella sp.]